MLVDYRQQIAFKSMVEHGTYAEDNDTDNYGRFWAKRNIVANIAGDVTYNFWLGSLFVSLC